MSSSAHRILGVSAGASTDDVKKAFRKKAMQWHPDRHQGEQAKAKAEVEFRRVTGAYEQLTGKGPAVRGGGGGGGGGSAHSAGGPTGSRTRYAHQEDYYEAARAARAAREAERQRRNHATRRTAGQAWWGHPRGSGFENVWRNVYQQEAARRARQERKTATGLVIFAGVAGLLWGAVKFASWHHRTSVESSPEFTDAWFNPMTRRYERPHADMYHRDNLIRGVIVRKPRGQVWDPASGKQGDA